MFPFVVIAVIAFSGLFVGSLLRRIAPEEVSVGRHYLFFFQYALLLGLVLSLLYPLTFTFPHLLSFALGFVASFLLRLRYLYLGLALTAAFSHSLPLSLLAGSLVFLYGLPYGSIQVSDHVSFYFRLAFFFVLPFLLLAFPFSSSSLLLAFSAGTLFLRK